MTSIVQVRVRTGSKFLKETGELYYAAMQPPQTNGRMEERNPRMRDKT